MPVDPNCPADKVNKNGLCVDCKEDELIVDGKCLKKSLYGCKPGQHMVGGICKDICAKGQEVVNGKCQKMCEKGTELKNGKCVKACSKDEVLINGKCQKKDPCVSGEVQVAGKCVKICPKGEEPIGEKCKRINRCKPNEMLKDGKCVKICPNDSVLKDGECVKKPQQCWTKRQCLLHWTNKNTNVTGKLYFVQIDRQEVMKNATDDKYRAPDAAKSGLLGGMTKDPRIIKLNQLRAKYLAKQKRYEIEMTKCTDLRCPKGIKCVKEVCATPGIFKCKKDEILKAKKCMKACGQGEVLKGSSCVKDCPVGTKPVGKNCVKTCKAPLSLVDGQCKKVCQKDQVLKGGICVKRNPCKPEEKFENFQCTKQCKTDEIVVNGACVKKNPCQKNEILKAGKCIKVCDAGFVLKHGACKKKCETNEILRDDKCVKICPSKWKLVNGKCVEPPVKCESLPGCHTRMTFLIAEKNKQIQVIEAEMKKQPEAPAAPKAPAANVALPKLPAAPKRRLQAPLPKLPVAPTPKPVQKREPTGTIALKQRLVVLNAQLKVLTSAKKNCFEKKCKNGEICENKTCKKEDAPANKCDEPKFWNNMKCIDCPKGTKRINKKCSKFTPSKCPPGWEKKADGKCGIIIIIVPVPKCGKDEKKVGDKCIKEDAPECDKPWVFNPKSGYCEKTIIEEVACDTGYKKDGDNCVKIIDVCPDGYKPDPTNKEECLKYEEPKCSPGYKKDSKGKCTKPIIIPVLTKCPADFKLDAKTKKCTKKLGPGTCPKKHKWDAKLKKCVRVIIHDPTPEGSCPKGYTKTPKGVCTKTDIVPFTCPKGYTPNKDGNCQKIIIIIEKGPIVCPKPSKQNEKTKQCVSIVTKPAICPKGTVREDNTNKCVKKPPHVKPLTCPPGFELKNRKCSKVTTKVSCKLKFKFNPETKKCEQVKIIVKCLPKFKLNKAGICVKLEKQEPCPKGFTINKDNCEKYTCETGFKLQGNKCIGKAEVCPPGYSPDSQDKSLCSKTMVPISCPKGFYLKNKVCVKKTIDFVCPKSYKYDEKINKCVKWEVKNPTCDKGMVRDGDDCVKQKDVGCPNGQVKDEQTGKCIACKKDEIVRDGKCTGPKKPCANKPNTIFKNGKCVPKVPTCPKGKKLVKGKCVAPTVPPTPKPVCKKDEVQKNGKCFQRCPVNTIWNGVKCIPQWDCYSKDKCVERYQKYIKEITIKITKLSGAGKKPTPGPTKVTKDPTKVTKNLPAAAPTGKTVKPQRQTKAPKTQSIKPTRRGQAMVKKPTAPKTPAANLKVQKEITVLKTQITIYKKLMSECKVVKCSKGLMCNNSTHKCVKPTKPKCKFSEILKHGKCLEKCATGFVRLQNGKCSKIVPIKCASGAVRDKDGNCKCPKGYKPLSTYSKECVEIPKPKPVAFTGKDRTSCAMRFSMDIKKLTDQKEILIDKWLDRGNSDETKTKLRKKLDYVNLQIAVMVADINECDELPIAEVLKVSSDIEFLKATHMCGAIPCTKTVHDHWIKRFNTVAAWAKKFYAGKQLVTKTHAAKVKQLFADSKKSWNVWKVLFKSQNKLAYVKMDAGIAKLQAERALAAKQTTANQEAVDTATQNLNDADSNIKTQIQNALKLLEVAIDKRVAAKKANETYTDIEFTEVKALDRANDTNKVVALVAAFEKSLAGLGTKNKQIMSAAIKSKSIKKVIAAEAAIVANRKQHQAHAVLLTKQIKEMMDQDAVIIKKSEELKSKQRNRTIGYQKEINKCKRTMMDTNMLKASLNKKVDLVMGKAQKMMLARRNLRMLQKLIKKQTPKAVGQTSKIDKKAMSELVTKLMAAEGSILECASTIKANSEIVEERLENSRTHVNAESKCTAYRQMTQRIINSKMGHYTETNDKLGLIRKQIAAKAAELKKAGNKNWRDVLRQSNMLTGYIYDTEYKAWTLNYQMSIVKGWQCGTS